MKHETWRWLLALGCLLLGSMLSEPARAAGDPSELMGPPVLLTPQMFERPLCLLVRSENCPQSRDSTAPACNFLYEYPGPDGLYHPVSRQNLFELLPPGMPVLILVHGSFVDFDEEPELLDTYEWIRAGAPDRPLLVLCYRWPSAIGCKAIFGSFAVCALAQRSEFHGFYLAQLINLIPAENSVGLLGHSHGCRMISAALHLLAGGRVNGDALPPCYWSNRSFRVTFFSAAIDHDWLNPGERYDLAINRMCWLQNHRHPWDWALLTYPGRYPGSSRALGQAGFTKKDLKRLGAQAAKIQQFDGHGPMAWGHSLKSHTVDPAVRPLVLSNIYSPCDCP